MRYSSLRRAAAVVSHHCTQDFTSANSNGLLWLSRRLIYYASPTGDPPDEVLTTRGRASIAYGFEGRGRGHWTAVVDVSTGARHVVGKGYPLAWSPDGEELALMRQSQVIPSPPGSIVAVPVTGGRGHLLFKVPAAPKS